MLVISLHNRPSAGSVGSRLRPLAPVALAKSSVHLSAEHPNERVLVPRALFEKISAPTSYRLAMSMIL